MPPVRHYWSSPDTWLQEPTSILQQHPASSQAPPPAPPRVLLFGGSRIADIENLVNNKLPFTPGSSQLPTHVDGHAWATFTGYNPIISHFSIFKQDWDVVYLHIGEEDLLVETVTPGWLADHIIATAEYISLLGVRRVIVGSLITKELETEYGRRVLETNRLLHCGLRHRTPELACVQWPMSMYEGGSWCAGSSRLALSCSGLHALLHHILDTVHLHARGM